MRTYLILLAALAFVPQPSSTPADVVNELLSADRAFSAAGAQKDVVSSLSAMFADDVTAAVPGGVFADGKAKLSEALRSNPDNVSGRIEWKPLRGGVSADGRHGFTFGYMTLRKADGSHTPLKYLSYWTKQADGWKVVGYKRRPRPQEEASSAAMEPSAPSRIVASTADEKTIGKYRTSLADAEKAFSDLAQKIGLGAAFTKTGHADAMNMGGPKEPGFVIGNVNIGRSVGEGTPTDSSPVSWAADHKVIVASSGDLGITFGFIRSNANAAQPPIPFFTIWRRASPSDEWRYIAE